MEYITWIIFILLLYYLFNLENKGFLVIAIIGIGYIYYENIIPSNTFDLPVKLYKQDFQFDTLDDLIIKYKSCNNQDELAIKNLIQREIDLIYFSFPNHQHKNIKNYLYRKYGF